MNKSDDLYDETARSCLICRSKLPKQHMLRLVVDGEGQVWPDLLQKLPGRGVYLCMEEACLKQTNDKRLGALKARFSVTSPGWDDLKGRIEMVLDRQLKQMFTRMRVKASIGRDAVMHRLWNNAPCMLLIAADAGDAVVRQIGDAVEKRKEAGYESVPVQVSSKLWLGEMFGRDHVAVAGLDAFGVSAAPARKLARFCNWYGYLRVIG